MEEGSEKDSIGHHLSTVRMNQWVGEFLIQCHAETKEWHRLCKRWMSYTLGTCLAIKKKHVQTVCHKAIMISCSKLQQSSGARDQFPPTSEGYVRFYQFAFTQAVTNFEKLLEPAAVVFTPSARPDHFNQVHVNGSFQPVPGPTHAAPLSADPRAPTGRQHGGVYFGQ